MQSMRGQSCLSSSPARSTTSNEDVFRDGLIDFQQLNYILRNPELPKSKVAINSILKQYNEEKCRAITLQRINYKQRNNNQINGNKSLVKESLVSNNNSNSYSNNSIDFDELSQFEVKLSQLPQELLVDILGETFSKYEFEINKRNERFLNKNQSDFDLNKVSVKQEVIDISDDDCDDCNNEPMICDFNIDLNIDSNINELKQQLKKLINDYELIEREEKSVSDNLQTVTQELENKLSALRECIALCEALKEQNLMFSQKQNELKTKKSELKHEINEIKDKLIELNNSYRHSINTSDNQMNVNSDNECLIQCVTQPIPRIESTSNQIKERQSDIGSVSKNEQMKNSEETILKKRKVVPNKFSNSNRKESNSQNDINVRNHTESDKSNNSLEGTSNKLRKLSIAKNDNKISQSNRMSADSCQQKTTEIQTIENENRSDNQIERNVIESDETLNNVNNDWRNNYVNFAFEPIAHQSEYRLKLFELYIKLN
jgi:hypothetical protein